MDQSLRDEADIRSDLSEAIAATDNARAEALRKELEDCMFGGVPSFTVTDESG